MGRPAIKLPEGLELVCGRPTLALVSALVHQKTTTNNKNKTNKTQIKSKVGSWIEGQVATVVKSHTRQIDKLDKTVS